MTDDPTVSTQVMTQMLGISAMHLGRLAKDGTLPEPVARGQWDPVATVRAYVNFVTQRGKKGEAERAEDFALVRARRRRTEHLAELAAIELAEKQGDVGSLAVMATEVASMLSALKGRLTSIGPRVAPSLEMARTTAERQTIVDAAIFEALDEISSSPFSFLGGGSGVRGTGSRDPGRDSDGDDEAAAEADPEPMG